ncbi:MAG: hypothetical protein AMXMBFR7_26860 [Planctomycetota bacterium]
MTSAKIQTGSVARFRDLPRAKHHKGQVWRVLKDDGWSLLRVGKQPGLYRSDGLVWERIEG